MSNASKLAGARPFPRKYPKIWARTEDVLLLNLFQHWHHSRNKLKNFIFPKCDFGSKAKDLDRKVWKWDKSVLFHFQVLLTSDDAEVRKIIHTANTVLEKLWILQSVQSWPEFRKHFQVNRATP